MNPLSAKLDQPAPVVSDVRPPADHSAGILCMSSGDRGALLRNFLGSLRATNPQIPFRILSDSPQDYPMIWVGSLARYISRRVKTQLHRHTPYELTLYLDDDTCLAKSLDLAEMLGDADLALGLDVLPTLGDASRLAKRPAHVPAGEIHETLRLCGPSFPFYNSGVLLFRRNAATELFFEAWHTEWEKYRRCDQFALARALHQQAVKVRCLAKTYNHQLWASHGFNRRISIPSGPFRQLNNLPNQPEKLLVPEAHIYHLLGKKPAAMGVGLWHPDAAGKVEHAYQKAVKQGLMSALQYQSIARMLCLDYPCSLLMVGGGYDADLWHCCVRGNVTYVEHNPAYLRLLPAPRVFFRYPTKLNIWCETFETPVEIDRPWDYVIVDGPGGFSRNCPGRQIPIAWAARLARKAVFVHDYDRRWERKLCDHYLGQPSRVISAEARSDRKLAIFMRSQAS